MTITLTLTPEEEAQLRHKAALLGQTPEAFLLAPLQLENAPTDTNGIGHVPSLAETLAGRVGLFDGNGRGHDDAHLPDDTALRTSLAEWLAEVEAVDAVPHPVPDENKEYVNALVEKYRKQGLQL